MAVLTMTYDQVTVTTATFSTLKLTANLTQNLNFRHHFHKEFELCKKNFESADIGRHFKIVSTLQKI